MQLFEDFVCLLVKNIGIAHAGGRVIGCLNIISYDARSSLIHKLK